MTPANIMTVIKLAKLYVGAELEAVRQAMTKLPATINAEIVKKVTDIIELEGLLDEAEDDMETFIDDLSRAKAQRDISLRWQKQWRIVACRVCLGGMKTDDLLQQAFYECIGDPPTHEQLDAELSECVTRLEAREKAQEEFGELRSIVLG